MGTRVLLAAPLRASLGISGSDNGLPVVDSRHPDARVAVETVSGTPLAIGVLSSLVDEISGQPGDNPRVAGAKTGIAGRVKSGDFVDRYAVFAGNWSSSPAEVLGRACWQRIGDLAAEVHTVPATDEPKNVEKPRSTFMRKRREETVSESGQATLGLTALLPLILLLMVVLWQVALWGISAAYAGHAADEAARAASIGQSPDQVQHAALDAVPDWIAGGITVTEQPDAVKVRARLPIILPGVSTENLTFTSKVGFVKEN